MDKLDIRQEEQLKQAYIQADNVVMKKYLPELSSREVVPMNEDERNVAISVTVRLFKLSKVVYDPKEIMQDKLSSVYNALAGNKGALVVLITSDGVTTEFFLGAKTDSDAGSLSACQNTLNKAFRGNFPGSDLTNLRNRQVEELMERVFASPIQSSLNTVAAVSGVASLRNEDKDRYVQGIEKLIDAMRGEKYSILFVADPISHGQLDNIRKGYEDLYTQLSPFASSDLQFSANESSAVTEGLTTGFSETVNESLSRTQATTENNSKTYNQSTNYGRNILISSLNRIKGGKTGASESESSTSGYSSTKTEGETTGTATTNSIQESKSRATTDGSGRSLQIKVANKGVQTLLERIDEQLVRLKKSEDLGLWNCAAYFVAEDVQTAKIAANTYKSLMRGDNSSVESSCVNTWDNNDKTSLSRVTDYVKKFRHPLICLGGRFAEDSLNVTPGSLVNGHELAIQAGLPLKSVSGLPVIETAEFGRNVVTYDNEQTRKSITLGDVFHMGATEPTPVKLDLDSLSMHTFITGSTGSGKSNTIYQILDKLNKQQVKFLVVEPAKGEYKQVFGGRKDVKVLGTNPAVTELLQMNPFAFPEGIHILEHIDRLIEIFNACWPMYAAMPAVLKEAIEQAYAVAGWDLEESVNYCSADIFPTFASLMDILPETIRVSEYSQEVKGNYIGALVTRVKSMTNGINGRIFSGQETENAVLFDSNCIVDLSRVGSVETKALIMGVLVMRLQEHRSVSADGMNSSLKHVTVLEEAHHLLRRTSSEQSQEGSNLQGKAVEMLTNAIAEMRTYGEGFIIADQSPSLLDMSVIRNTNTKLVLRLPDESDRQLVGKAANLNDDQIAELAKLRVGVAAIYQNNWLQPVLCLSDRFEESKSYRYEPEAVTVKQHNRDMLGRLTRLLLNGRISTHPEEGISPTAIEPIRQWLLGQKNLNLDSKKKAIVERQLDEYEENGRMDVWRQESFGTLSSIISSLYSGKRLLQSANRTENMQQWNDRLAREVRCAAELSQNEVLENAVIQCLLRDQSEEGEEAKQFYFLWVEEAGGRGIA